MLHRHLYLAPHASEPIFKIGIANDVWCRLQQVAMKGAPILWPSVQVTQAAPPIIERLEQVLRWTFQRWNLAKGPGEDGHTEWYELACRDCVIDQVQTVGRLLACPLTFAPLQTLPLIASRPRSRSQVARRDEDFKMLEAHIPQRAEMFVRDWLRFSQYVVGRTETDACDLYCLTRDQPMGMNWPYTGYGIRLKTRFPWARVFDWCNGQIYPTGVLAVAKVHLSEIRETQAYFPKQSATWCFLELIYASICQWPVLPPELVDGVQMLLNVQGDEWDTVSDALYAATEKMTPLSIQTCER